MNRKVNVNGFDINVYFHDDDIQSIMLPLLRRWTEIQRMKNSRIFVFLAAPPGTGKTTLALFLEILSHEYNDITTIQTIGIDGFHYFNSYLETHNIKENEKVISLKSRKGAPYTFDVEKLIKKITEAQKSQNMWPLYSRTLHDPIDNQIQLKSDIVLIEGNYLLYNKGKWKELINYCDDSIFIYADKEILKQRLINRKIKGGLIQEKAESFYEKSDMKNVESVLDNHYKANIHLEMDSKGRFHYR